MDVTLVPDSPSHLDTPPHKKRRVPVKERQRQRLQYMPQPTFASQVQELADVNGQTMPHEDFLDLDTKSLESDALMVDASTPGSPTPQSSQVSDVNMDWMDSRSTFPTDQSAGDVSPAPTPAPASGLPPDIPIIAQAGFKVVNLTGLASETPIVILVCPECKTGVQSISKASLKQHLGTHNVPFNMEQLEQLADSTADLCPVVSSGHFPDQTVVMAPVADIEITEGFKCDDCFYACQKPTVMSQHHSKSSHYGMTAVYLQRLFLKQGPFFVVEPALAKLPPVPQHLLRCYLQQLAPSMNNLRRNLATPTVQNDLPPLVRQLGWHDLLASHLKHKDNVRALFSLMDISKPARQAPRLREAILDYLLGIKTKVIKAIFPVRQILQDPR